MKSQIKLALECFNCLEIVYEDEKIIDVGCGNIKIENKSLLIDCIFCFRRVFFKDIIDIKGYYFNNEHKFSVIEKFNKNKVIKFLENRNYRKIRILYDNFKEKTIEKRTISFNKNGISCYDALTDYKVFFELEFYKINNIQNVI